ncbi:Lysophospholipid acyltransferase [Zostera marina]|uniref:Lysophospholipid acyltransferase n=1 Tax=Zostera marina TaxID=29655 RepID=A0A0K9PHR0_ZOSMR|nr:Lysophospholipid acyltransferase [Zostera marina]
MSIPNSSVENGLIESLLPSTSADFVVNVDIGESGPAVRSNPSDQDGSDLNPYEFMGATGFTLPPPCPIDPFMNRTESITGMYEWIKIIVCLPLALVRLAMFGVAIVVGFLATKLALQGWKDKTNPMPRWRSRIMWITRICARCILFSFGYHWIRRKGRPVSRETAPVVVSNHVSYIEPIFYFYELFPTMVSSESHDSIPFVGTIIRAMQVIYVDRFSAASRKYAVSEIKRKASSDQFPRVLLFPEGTTTNGRSLISFQLGAFIPGLPIQPVVVRYPHVHFDQSWGNISLLKLMFRMFTQFHNFMEVEYLPVVSLSQTKRDDPKCFAEKISFVMASALNVVQTSHSYGDMMLFTKALELTKGKSSDYMIEMARVQNTYSISTLEALEFLDKFLAMKPDPDGLVKFRGFLSTFNFRTNAIAAKIFDFIDIEKKGSITFRQYLLGSVHILNQPTFRTKCEAAFNAYCNIFSNDDPRCQSVKHLYMFNNNEHAMMSRDDFMAFMKKNPLLITFFCTH